MIAPEPVPTNIGKYCSDPLTKRPNKYCFAYDIAAHYECGMRQAARLDELDDGRRLILWVLLGAGLLVVLGMGVYGIKMTHKVAGPLFKVSMYFDKMTVGKLGRVTALRKGDMLNDFYDGFKEMHEAVRARLQGDVAAMQKLVEACAAAGLDKTPGFGAEVEQLARHVEDRKAALS